MQFVGCIELSSHQQGIVWALILRRLNKQTGKITVSGLDRTSDLLRANYPTVTLLDRSLLTNRLAELGAFASASSVAQTAVNA